MSEEERGRECVKWEWFSDFVCISLGRLLLTCMGRHFEYEWECVKQSSDRVFTDESRGGGQQLEH